jgi:feruloyl esterase
LSDFIAGGGKLLIYHGTTDGMLPYKNSVNYYESAVKALGAEAIDDNVKFYLVPGMDHCSGGEGAFLVDWLSALELWEEEGLTPAALQGVHPAAGSGQSVGSPGKVFTRPICPYPQIAQYNGGGDPDDAASFRCADPQIQP